MTIFAVMTEFVDAVGAWKDTDLIAALLMGIFLVTVGIGLLSLSLVVHFFRNGRWPFWSRNSSLMGRPFRQLAIGLPCRWLAIKSSQPMSVQEALRLNEPTPCSWAEGLATAQEKKLFISPPIGGWVLALGSGLPDPAQDIDKCYLLLMDLSRKLGYVQFFSFSRSLHHHAWAQASHGRILRAYAWAGQTLWNQGQITRSELDLHLRCFEYGESAPEPRGFKPNPVALNTEKVPLLAARWSIDPAEIDPRALRETHGITGQLSWRKSG